MKRILLSWLLATVFISSAMAQEAKSEVLPEGALVRFGTQRFRDLGNDYSPKLHIDGKSIIVKDNTGAQLYSVSSGEKTGVLFKSQNTPMQLTDSLSHALIGSFSSITVVTIPDGKKIYETKPRKDAYSDSFYLSGDGSTIAKLQPADRPKTDKERVGTIVFENTDGSGKATTVKTIHDVSMQCRFNRDGSKAVSWGSFSVPREYNSKADPSTNPTMRFQCWDIKAGKELCQVGLSSGFGLTNVAMSPKGDVVAATTGANLYLFDSSTGKQRQELNSYRRAYEQLTFSPDGSLFAAASSDGSVSIWDVASGRLVSFVPGPFKAASYNVVKSIVFTGKDTAYVLGGNGIVTAVWEVPSGKLISSLGDETEIITAVTFAKNDQEVLSFGTTGKFTKWNISGNKIGTESVPLKSASSAYLSSPSWMSIPSGGRYLGATVSDSFIFFDTSKNEQVFATSLGNGYGNYLKDISKDGTIAVNVFGQNTYEDNPKPGTAAVFSTKDFIKTAEFPIQNGNILDAALTPDGKMLSYLRTITDKKSNNYSSFLNTVSTSDGKAISEVPVKSGYSRGYVLPAADGKTMYCIPSGEQVLIPVTVETGEAGKPIRLPFTLSNRPVRSADGKLMAFSAQTGYGSGISEIVIIDLTTGKKTNTFKGHGKRVSCMAFSSDGKKLATGSDDTTVLVWDLAKSVEQ